MRHAIALLLIVTTVFVFTPIAEADQATYHKYQSIKRWAKSAGKRAPRLDGYSCSCSITCTLGQGSFRTGGWGFARGYSSAVDRAEDVARDKCTSKVRKTKLMTIRGRTIGAATCDEKEQCYVHFTPAD